MSPEQQQLSQLSHHVDAMEVIAEHIDGNHPLALANLRARLARLQRTIEAAAVK
jgi:hypothetical protein